MLRAKGYPTNVIIDDKYREAQDTTIRELELALHPMLESFLRKASGYFPQFYFKPCLLQSIDNIVFKTKYLNVYSSDAVTRLGEVSLVVKAFDYKLCFHNRKIERAAKRGNSVSTGKESVAMATFKKYFREDSVAEKVAKSRMEIIRHIKTVDVKTRVLETTYATLSKGIMTHVLTNLDEYGPIAIANGTASALVDGLPELYEDTLLLQKIKTACDNNTGYLVIQQNGEYFIDDLAKNVQNQLVHDQLSIELREKLGMLKLVENSTFVRDIGLKLNETSFYVMPIIDKVN